MVELMQFRTAVSNLSLRLSARSRGLQLGAPIVTFRHGSITPAWPPGMSVTACEGILITLRPEMALSEVCVSARWETPFTRDPSPATGQRLDAQEWIEGGRIVLLGTEDGDALAERLPTHGLDPETYRDAYPVRYLTDGFNVVLPKVPAGTTTTLHFVVAINAYPEPVGDSAWFAVDVPHQRVLAALAG